MGGLLATDGGCGRRHRCSAGPPGSESYRWLATNRIDEHSCDGFSPLRTNGFTKRLRYGGTKRTRFHDRLSKPIPRSGLCGRHSTGIRTNHRLVIPPMKPTCIHGGLTMIVPRMGGERGLTGLDSIGSPGDNQGTRRQCSPACTSTRWMFTRRGNECLIGHNPVGVYRCIVIHPGPLIPAS